MSTHGKITLYSIGILVSIICFFCENFISRPRGTQMVILTRGAWLNSLNAQLFNSQVGIFFRGGLFTQGFISFLKLVGYIFFYQNRFYCILSWHGWSLFYKTVMISHLFCSYQFIYLN